MSDSRLVGLLSLEAWLITMRGRAARWGLEFQAKGQGQGQGQGSCRDLLYFWILFFIFFL